MCMRLIKILEGICARKDGESDSDYLTRCGNALTNDRDKVLYFPKTFDRDEDELDILGTDLDEDGMPGGIGVGLTLPGGYINGAPDEKKVKKLSKKLHQKEEDVVTDNEIDRKDMLLNKYLKSIIKAKKEANVLEGDVNKPSPKLRPEPHPTRHEIEHPPYEKDALSAKVTFKAPTKK